MTEDMRQAIGKTRRWVIKIGSAMLTAGGDGLDLKAMGHWVEQIVELIKSEHEIVLVSSGAVAEGMSRMGWQMRQRPTSLHALQAMAAIGQMGLVRAWEDCFARQGKHTAQVLLTHDDLTNRKRYLNARSTLQTLIAMGVVPVINENDAVANEELRFGDNDTLAALVANLVQADLLVLLTDQSGLFTSDPRKNADAVLIEQAFVTDEGLDEVAGGAPGTLGRGGMQTKLRASRLAARSGTKTIIASGAEKDGLRRIAKGDSIGTLLLPKDGPAAARKQWLAGHLQVRGKLYLDDGAVKVLRSSGKSLLAVGVKEVSGNFSRGEAVSCVDLQGKEIARGLVNYSASEARQIAGKPSREIAGILGYLDDEELIHRDNLVLI